VDRYAFPSKSFGTLETTVRPYFAFTFSLSRSIMIEIRVHISVHPTTAIVRPTYCQWRIMQYGSVVDPRTGYLALGLSPVVTKLLLTSHAHACADRIHFRSEKSVTRPLGTSLGGHLVVFGNSTLLVLGHGRHRVCRPPQRGALHPSRAAERASNKYSRVRKSYFGRPMI